MSAWGWGVCSGGDLLRGCVCPGGYTPVDRMTDACENITFPQLLLWTVKKQNFMKQKEHLSICVGTGSILNRSCMKSLAVRHNLSKNAGRSFFFIFGDTHSM